MKRSGTIERTSMAMAAVVILLAASACTDNSKKTEKVMTHNYEFKGFDFPALPYAYDALEPYIDAQTMEIHYDRHYRAYYNNFLAAIKGTEAENMPLEAIFAKMSSYSDAVRNNGGGYYNHMMFWSNMSPDGGEPSAALSKAIDEAFGSMEKFKELFGNAGKTRFGSGWAWLVVTPEGKLAVGSTPNQDNPLMDISPIKGKPILGLDVWEHAYYLKYQNKRPDYVENFWKVVNWKDVSARYETATK